jgi:hypothetical protein
MMGAVLIAASFLTALASPPSAARATTGDGSESKKGCVEFQIDFFPTRVLPGQGMDMDYSLANCSSMRERLVVPLRFKGPCPFIPSTVSRYTLGPQMGFGTSALIIAPDCRGHYRVKAQVLYRGRVLDHAVAGFTVLPTH